MASDQVSPRTCPGAPAMPFWTEGSYAQSRTRMRRRGRTTYACLSHYDIRAGCECLRGDSHHTDELRRVSDLMGIHPTGDECAEWWSCTDSGERGELLVSCWCSTRASDTSAHGSTIALAASGWSRCRALHMLSCCNAADRSG